MFWGCILYKHISAQLTFHIYKAPYETPQEKLEADVQFQREYEQKLAEKAFHHVNGDYLDRDPKLKTRGRNRKGGIDWFIYRERI
jgi:hypothetical protein